MEAGETLIELNALRLREQLAERRAELAVAEAMFNAERAGAQVRAQTARERTDTLRNQIAQLQSRIETQTITASAAGLFVPDASLRDGAQVQSGDRLGALLSRDGEAVLSGPFPERYVAYFRDGVRAVDLRLNGVHHSLPAGAAQLQERVALNRQSGQREYVVMITAPFPTADLVAQRAMVRLQFRSEALWRRAWFHIQGLLQNLQDVRMSELGAQHGLICGAYNLCGSGVESGPSCRTGRSMDIRCATEPKFDPV